MQKSAEAFFSEESEENKTFFSEWKKQQDLGPGVKIEEVYSDLNRCKSGMLCPVRSRCHFECPDRIGVTNRGFNAVKFENCRNSFYKIMNEAEK